MTGIVVFIKHVVRGSAAAPISTPCIVAWIVISVILIWITPWSWLGYKKK